MSTTAQITANRANAQQSSGPKTPEGKAISSQNGLKHGFAGAFQLLPGEDPSAFQSMLDGLKTEHAPLTMTENILVERMAQSQWLVGRAIRLQTRWFEAREETGPGKEEAESTLALYIRYQTTNERAFSKCLSDLLKLRAERRKLAIGFESQARASEENARRQSVEKRKQDLHQASIWLAEAKAEHQELLNAQLETPETRLPDRVGRILARLKAA